MSQQNVVLKCQGLYSYPNHLISVPNGALLRARNVVINRDNIAESRRGFKIVGNAMGSGSTTTAHQLLEYKGRLLRHYGTSAGTTLEYDTTGAFVFSTFSLVMTGDTHSSTTIDGFTTTSTLFPGMTISGTGIPSNTTISSITSNTAIVISNSATATAAGVSLTFNVVVSEVSTGTRIKGIEANGNHYFTTSTGIKKISAASASGLSSALITNAGGVKSLDIQTALNSTTGFFTQDSVVAYRVVWGIKDANNNIILGVPSNRSIIYNTIPDLLINNFNALLSSLDNVSNSGGINDANYVTTLKIPANSPAATIRTNLLSLASKLDADTVITEGAINTATTQRVSATSLSLVFNSSVATFLEVGDKINITGVATGEINNNIVTITSVSTTTVVGTPATNYGGTDGAPVVEVGGAVQRLKYTYITQPSSLSSTPTTTQLTSLQTYYDAIVDYLQSELSGIITTPSNFNSSGSTQSATVNVTIPIPRGITTTHFYQIYRTALTTSTGALTLSDFDPGDEQKLVYEANPTNTDLTAGTITVQDITPDSFRGANLYTNTDTGEGFAQANDVPPIALDIAAYKNYTFYANTKTKHRKQLSMLSVTGLTSGTSSLTITDADANTQTYTFVFGKANTQTVTCVADVADSLNGDYFTLNGPNNTNLYYVWYKTSGGAVSDPAVSGRTGIRVDITTGDTNAAVASATKAAINEITDFTASVSGAVVTIVNNAVGICTAAANGTPSPGFTYATTVTGQGEDVTNKKVLFTPVMSGNITGTSIANPTSVTSAAHGLVSGQIINITGSNSTPSIDGTWVVTVTGTDTFTIPVNVTAISTTAPVSGSWAIAPALTPAQQIEQTAQSLIKVVNRNASEVVYASYLSGPSDVPGLMLFESRLLSGSAFHFTVNSTTTGSQFEPTLPTSGTTIISDNEIKPNRIYYSKVQQPEAVPLLNYIDVGPQDKSIIRILALRDSLFILKEEAIYRLSSNVAPFVVTLLDSSTSIKGGDTAAILNNQIYANTDQGIATITDSGVQIISRSIEDLIVPIASSAYTYFSTASFGVPYETDRSYYFFTVTDTTDTTATQCFRYNTFTNTWTQLLLEKTCGKVLTSDNKLYLGANDTNYIEQERKSFDRTDYADREYAITLGASAVDGTTVTLPSVTNVSVNDTIEQTQYLTIYQFNRLLSKLDTDALISPKDYTSTLEVEAGDTLSTAFDALVAKIAADTGRTAVAGATAGASYTALSGTGTTFALLQTAFNSLITLLNADLGIAYSNYVSSSGTVSYEFNVVSVDTDLNTIEAPYEYPLITGPITVYSNIETQVQWVPQYMGDVSMTKQVSEATTIFEDSSFTEATVSFATDISGNFEEQLIPGSGNGLFGNTPYGESTYGGNGISIPLRTYIPRQKQRCRYMLVRFDHAVAREQYALYGISLTFSPTSQRGYR